MAVALGLLLALRFLRGARFPWAVGVAHGLAGAAGFGLLLVVLQGPRRGDAMGVGSFGANAAVLFGIALALGPFVVLLYRRAPRVSAVILAAHASAAITGFVLFLAWVSMG